MYKNPPPPHTHAAIAPEGESWRRQLIAVVGSSFVGKTHWLRHLFLKIHPQFHYGVVFSSTDKVAGEYDWIPRENRYDTWEDRVNPITGARLKMGFKSVITYLISNQARNIITMGQDKAPHIFIIIDDPMGSVDFHKSDEFKAMAGQLRKYNMTMIILTQYVRYLPPLLRNGCHRLVIFQNTEEDMVKIKEMIIGFNKKSDWLTFVTESTKNFGGILYNRVTRSFTTIRAPPNSVKYTLSF